MTIFAGKRVVILGAARQGQALARFLSRRGAEVTLSDRQNAEQLQEVITSFSDTNVNWALGGHPIELLARTDLVAVSGGVPLTLPFIQEAFRQNIPVTNDSELFMQELQAPVVGITGSAGKTTTTTLVGRMAKAGVQPPRRVWMGGNIGNPLIELVEEIKADDVVILELSSFQLELMHTSPHIAAVLNITPNHLDRHGTMSEYIRAKSSILKHQQPGDIAILNREDPESWNLRQHVCGHLISFGFARPENHDPAVYLENGKVVFQQNGLHSPLLDSSMIQLRGNHNLMNVIAACAMAAAMQLSPSAMHTGVEGFTGVSHRLELVRIHNGVKWINDSIATAPERTLAALTSFTEPVVLLLGGRDKNLPWSDLAQVIHQRVDRVIIFGEASSKIEDAIGQPHGNLKSVATFETMKEALVEASNTAKAGDVVLLSPGCTSYDAYKDFEERGEEFRKWVNEL